MANTLKSIKDIESGIEFLNKKLELSDKLLIQISKNIRLSQEGFKKIKFPKEVSEKIKQSEKSTKELNSAVKEQERLEKALSNAIIKKNEILTTTNKSLVKTRVETQILNKQVREAAKVSSKLSTEYEKQSVKLNQLIRRQQDLAIKQELGIKLSAKELKQLKRLTAQIQRKDRALKKVDLAVGRSQRNVGNYAGALRGAASAVRSLASAMGLVGGAFLFVSVIRNTINITREFGATMATLAGVFRTTREELSGLEAEIISVAGASVTTSNDVAKLAETLATLGKTPEEIKKLLKPVNNLAIGLKASADEAAEFLIQNINAFQGSVDEAEKYADIIATIRTSTSLDFQKMRDSFQFLTPISKILNKDLAFTGALIGILADNGVKAQRAGRLLGTSQQKLAKEGKTLADALKEVNDASDSGIKGVRLLAIASNLFGKQAASLGIILAQNSDIIESNAQAIRDNGGALDDLINEQLKSLDAEFKILNSRWEEYILNVDESSNASNSLRKILKFLGGNIEGIISSIITLTTAFIAYKAVLFLANIQQGIANLRLKQTRIAAFAAAKGVSTLSVRWAAFNKVLKANILGIVVIAVTALIFALKRLDSQMSKSAKKQKALNDIRDVSAKSIAGERAELDTLLNTAKNDNLSKEQRLKAIKELNKISPEYLGTITLESINTKATTEAIKIHIEALNRLALEKAIAVRKTELFVKKIEAENSSISDNIGFIDNSVFAFSALFNRKAAIISLVDKGIEARKKNITSIQNEIDALNELSKKGLEAAKETEEPKENQTLKTQLTQKEIDQRIKDALNLAKLEIQIEVDKQKEIRDNEDKNLVERLNANDEFVNKSIELLELQKKANLKKAKGRASELKRIELQFQQDKAKIVLDGEKGLEDIIKTVLTRRIAANKEARRIETEALNRQIIEQQNKLIEALEVEGLSAKQKEELIKDSEDKIFKIKREAAIKNLELRIETAKAELKIAESLDPEKALRIQEAITAAEIALSNLKTKNAISNSGKEQESIDFINKLRDDAISSSISLVNTLFDVKVQKIDDEIQINNDKFAQLLNNENLSEEQRSALEAQRETKNAELEKKKRKEQARQAKFNKAISLLEIGISTAQAIAKAVALFPATGGQPFASIAAAIGIIQAGIVLATPIPKFEKGKGKYNDYEGVGIWGEKRREIKFGGDGSIEVSPKKIGNHLTNIKKNDVIHPNADKFFKSISDTELIDNIDRYSMLSNIMTNNSNADNIIAASMLNSQRQSRDTQQIVNAINNIKTKFNLHQSINVGEDLAFQLLKDSL